MPRYEKEELLTIFKKKGKTESIELQKRFEQSYDGFWEFQKYMDPDFYNEERKDLKLVSFVFYLLAWSHIYKCALSMMRRVGKSHSVNDLVKYEIGFRPERSNARFSHSGNLVKKHSKFIRAEIQRKDYLTVFPKIKLQEGSKAWDAWSITLAKTEATFACAGIEGAATGNGVNNILIGDDMIHGMKEALSEAEKQNLKDFRKGNFLSSKEGGTLLMRLLEVATIWTEDDPIPRAIESAKKAGDRVFLFDAYYKELTDDNIYKFINSIIEAKPTKDDWVQILIPALDKNDKSTCQSFKSTKELQKERKDLFTDNDDYMWWSIWQQRPRPKGAMLFEDFKNYFYYEDIYDDYPKNTVYKSGKVPDGKICFIDPAGKGNNNTSAPIGLVYGDNIYITDTVYTPDEPKVSKAEIIKMFLRHLPDMVWGEGNGLGEEYLDNLEEQLLKEKLELHIDVVYSGGNKETKIFITSDWIKSHIYIPFEEDRNGERQYKLNGSMHKSKKSLTKYVGRLNGKLVKNQEDDFLDSVIGFKGMIGGGDVFSVSIL